MLEKLEQMMKMLEVLSRIPLYYKCNEKTWAELKTSVPNRIVLPDGCFAGVKIRVYEDCEDGFHPVFKVDAVK